MFKRPTIELEVYEVPRDLKETYWSVFRKHHYLAGNLNRSARCWVAYLWDNPAAFSSALAMPSGSLKGAWRGHRLVVLCDYQGMGVGKAFTELTGEILIGEGKRYYCKTANIKLGTYRNNSDLWRPTGKNMRKRSDMLSKAKSDSYPVSYNNTIDYENRIKLNRVCFSHEYIGC